VAQAADQRGRRRFILDAELFRIELVGADAKEAGAERRWILPFEAGRDRPIFFRLKGLDLALALTDDAHRHRLHASSREAAADLFPQYRADLIADEAVENASRLLCFIEVAIELLRMANRFLDGAFGDLVE